MSFRDWLADPDTLEELHEIQAELKCGKPLAVVLMLLMEIGQELHEQNTLILRGVVKDEDDE